jgi:hypothetical protein
MRSQTVCASEIASRAVHPRSCASTETTLLLLSALRVSFANDIRSFNSRQKVDHASVSARTGPQAACADLSSIPFAMLSVVAQLASPPVCIRIAR